MALTQAKPTAEATEALEEERRVARFWRAIATDDSEHAEAIRRAARANPELVEGFARRWPRLEAGMRYLRDR